MKKIVCLSVFLALACKNSHELPDPLEAGWKGESVCEVLNEDDTMRMLKCTFPAGVGHEKHYHKPHFGYALKGGTFKIVDSKGTRTVTIKTGVNFSNDVETVHQVQNVGDSTAIFLIIEHK